MTRGRIALVVEALAWIVLFPVACVMLIVRLLGHGGASRERRILALLDWYPAQWRSRHGDEFATLMRDTMDAGHDGLRTSLDVVRAGLGERLRLLRPSRLAVMLTTALGCVSFFAQGLVAALLSAFEGVPPTWFLALHFTGQSRWLVVGAMVMGGATLMAMSITIGRRLASFVVPGP